MSAEPDTITLDCCRQLPTGAHSYGLARGDRLGRYVVLRALGSGGMGLVYEAHDTKLDRNVAIKLLRDERTDEADRVALLHEAKALARLSHPNVVAVFDRGFVDGRPYIVVERVEGENLSRWLTSRRRPWREVLRRFLQAGRGLAAIHRAGLIHCDVKPSNMIVDVRGRVRIIDLGLASIGSEMEPGGNPVATTGTPGFLAPEQLRGDPVDELSDQFAFCSAVWKGIFGTLPFGADTNAEQGERVAYGELDDGDNPRATPRWLSRILSKGLRDDPHSRYACMDELLVALDRDPRRRYRQWAIPGILLTMWVAAYSLSGRSIDSLCGGAEQKLIDTWGQDHRTALRKVIRARAPIWAHESAVLVVDTLDDYARRWSVMHREVCRATRVHGEQSEKLMDLRMACLEERLEELGTTVRLLSNAGESLLSRAPSVAASLSRIERCADRSNLGALQPLPAGRHRRNELDRARRQMAEVKSLQNVGRYAEAQPLAEAALAAAKTVGYRPAEARAALLLGANHGRMGRWSEAESSFYDALAAAQAGHADHSVARAWLDLVIIGWGTGRFDDAERHARLADAAIDRLGGDPELEAKLDHRRGMLENRQHRFEAALAYFERARVTFEVLHGRGSPRVGQTLNNTAIALRHLGRHGEAAALYHQTIEIEQARFGQLTPSAAGALSNLSLLHLSMGELTKAEAFARRSLAVYEATVGAEHPSLAGALVALGEALLARDDPEAARVALDRARTLRVGVAGNDPSWLAEVDFLLARALMRGGDGPRRARQLAVRALEGFRAAGPRAEADVAAVEAWLADHG